MIIPKINKNNSILTGNLKNVLLYANEILVFITGLNMRLLSILSIM